MLDPAEMPALLEEFLAQQDTSRPPAKVVEFSPLSGGYSRSMARFATERDGTRGEYVLRGDPPAGFSMVDSDREREWQLLRALASTDVPTPIARWFDGDGALGTKAIVLDFLEGSPLPAAAQADGFDPAATSYRLCQLAATIHATDLDVLPLAIERPLDWDAYIDERLALFAATDRAQSGSDPFLRYIGALLDRHRPAPAPLGLVHGDFQSPNVLVAADGALSIVDWELARVGDPREDLGRFMVVAAVTPPDLVSLDLDGFCARYREHTGLSDVVINPASLAYFAILGSIDFVALLLKQFSLFTTGLTDSVLLAYVSNMLAFIHETYMEAADRAVGRDLVTGIA